MSEIQLDHSKLKELLKHVLAGRKLADRVKDAVVNEWKAGYLSVVSALAKYGYEKALSAPSLNKALEELEVIAKNPMLDDFTRGFLVAWIDALKLVINEDKVGSARESRTTAKGARS